MHCRRAGQDRADRGRAHLICDGLQQRDRQCSRTCEGKRKTDEVFILAWARTKTRQLEPSNKRNEGLRQQRQLESGRDAGGAKRPPMGSCMLHSQEGATRKIMRSFCAGFPWVRFWHLIMR